LETHTATIRRPNPPFQPTRVARRDRAHFALCFRAKRDSDLDSARLNGKPLDGNLSHPLQVHHYTTATNSSITAYTPVTI
jgi:hypothetical protein